MKMEKMIGSGVAMVLQKIGLQKKQSKARLVLPAIGLLTIGLVMGGVLGRMLFPKRRVVAVEHDAA